MPADIAGIIRGIGPKIDAVRTGKLYEPLQQREPYTDAVVTRDVAYGPAPRNTADIFIPLNRGPRKPVLVFVYGGGFAGGAKHMPGSPFYDNIGRWAAAHNLVGVTATTGSRRSRSALRHRGHDGAGHLAARAYQRVRR